MSDDESKPMTRTELAMLWDLAGRWISTHPANYHPTLPILDLRDHIDTELTERFGG